jgi:transcription initiation factor TFIIE subunit alpha
VAVRKKAKTPRTKSAKRSGRKVLSAPKRVLKAPKLRKPLKKVPKRAVKAIREAKKIEKEPELKKPQETEQQFLQRVTRILSDSNVRQNLIGIGGENALAIVRNFYGNHSDEDLAKKLKIKISDVRATLNKLHNEGLVNYIREKDSETGWYSYSWSLNQDRMEKWASSQLGRFNISGEGADLYFCPSCGTSSITNFESASVLSFKCDRCNRMLEFIDEKRLEELYEKSKA